MSLWGFLNDKFMKSRPPSQIRFDLSNSEPNDEAFTESA